MTCSLSPLVSIYIYVYDVLQMLKQSYHDFLSLCWFFVQAIKRTQEARYKQFFYLFRNVVQIQPILPQPLPRTLWDS